MLYRRKAAVYLRNVDKKVLTLQNLLKSKTEYILHTEIRICS